LRETQTKALIEELIVGDLGAVMLALPAPEPDVEVLPLFEDPFVLAVPADDPHPETARVSAQDVDQSRFILLEQGRCLRDQALAFCAPMQLRFGAASLATIMQMVAHGYAVTLLP
jgi:LysR family hydrogen peroxide-inducible transcriptional activator